MQKAEEIMRVKVLFIQGVALVYVNPKMGNSTGQELQKCLEQNFQDPKDNPDIRHIVFFLALLIKEERL